MLRVGAVVAFFIAAVAVVPVYFLLATAPAPGICGSDGAPPAPSVSFGAVVHLRNGSDFDYNLPIVSAQSGTVAGQLAVTVRAPSGSPDENVTRILLTGASGQTIGAENTTTGVWSQGAKAPLVVGENLTIVSSTSLTGDAVYVTMPPEECGYTTTEMIPLASA